MKRIGVDSLLLISITSGFTGLVTALQAIYQTKGFIPLDYIGVMVGKSTMTELAPVLTALVLTGKVGASLTAEIGTMKVTEQVDALYSLAIEPHDYLYMPRIVAGLVMFPILTIFANLLGIVSAYFFSVFKYGMNFSTFFTNMQNHFEPFDLWSGLIKSLVFGFVITTVACFCGHLTKGGAEGVGRMTTNSVVYSAILILIFDFVVAWFLFGVS
jgi:phospholipid/cholesterol/gamma-HCH transport system permease protein